MLVAMGTDTSDVYIKTPGDDVISVGDISQAFLVANDYEPGDQTRYVKYQAYKGGPVRVFQLKGPLYGQRDAGYKWYETLVEWLTSDAVGFKQSDTDLCLFYNADTKLRLAVHVDDVILRGSRVQSERFWEMLQAKFPLKHWEYVEEGQPQMYTGIQIGKQVIDGAVHYTMTMEHDIRVFIEDYGMTEIQPVTAPMPGKQEILSDESGVSEQEHKQYRAAVGSLSWFVGCRDDIAYEVSRLAQYLSAPTQGALKALRRVVGYLASTADRKLVVPRVTGNEWQIYSDSDHGGQVKAGCTRSQTGVIILLNSMPVFWKSNKQPVTALSSAEAEVYAMMEAVKEARLRLWIAEEAGIEVTYPLTLMVDNAAGESFCKATAGLSKLRGVYQMRESRIKELRDAKVVTAKHVDTTKNLADKLTKGLSHVARAGLDQELDRIRKELLGRAGAL